MGNVTSGVYTAPKDGIYLFGFDNHKCSGNKIGQVDVIHNSKLVKTIIQNDEKPQSIMLTSYWTLEMKSGDTIYLVNKQKSSLYTHGTDSILSFIGFYLS